MDIESSKDQLVLQLPLIIGNIPLRRNFANLENDSLLNVNKQFFIPFKHYKQRGLRKYFYNSFLNTTLEYLLCQNSVTHKHSILKIIGVQELN